MTIRAIVNVATGHYVAGQDRLVNSAFPEVSITWTDGWPRNSPQHHEAPYAFKPMAVKEVRDGHSNLNINQVLWMDASCVVNKPLDPIWAYIEEHGILMFEDGWTIGQWCKDAALEPLGFKSRDEALAVPLIYACVMGFDFRKTVANEFLDRWVTYALDGVTFPGSWTNANGEASSDPRCLGHRHDQTVASALAWQMGVPLYKGFHPFLSSGTEHDTIIQLAGI